MDQVPASGTQMNGPREQNTNGETELPLSVVQGLFMGVILVLYGWHSKSGTL